MSTWIYNLGIFIYDLGLKVASNVNDKAKKIVEGRRDTWNLIANFSKENHENVAWFHAASLGEFEQGRPIIEKLKSIRPDTKVLVTFFSPSGYEVRKNYAVADMVCYLPSDTSANAEKFLDLIRPKTAIFIKYEFWYHILCECSERKILTISVSSIFRNGQPFFKFYGGLHRKMLSYFDYFFVQDDNSKMLLSKIGVDRVTVSGDTRFDRVVDIAAQRKTINEVESFKANEKMMVLGSVWPSDMEVLLPFLKNYEDQLKFVIAPHNIGEKDINEIKNQFGNQAILFSQIEKQNLSDYRYLIIDNIGMLSSLYGYGEFAYVGGAFRKTLHNTLEAATYGIPVFFGDDPTNQKFKEAIELANSSAGIPIKTTSDLITRFNAIFKDEDLRNRLGAKATKYVEGNTGATEMVVNYLNHNLK